jgi:hypothetical protein
MKVKELVELLNKIDPEMIVCYELFSERCVLTPEELKIVDACIARPDGWIQNARPDKETQKYLCFPGN